MKSSIKTIMMLAILITTLVSCNQDPTLQTYYVDNELQSGFTSLDVPTSFLKIDESTLTETQLEAYNSVDKLNMLAFVISEENKATFTTELAKLQTILKDSKYQELIRGGNAEDGRFTISFIGEEDDIDELILFGYSKDKGFATVRVLGDHMSVNKLMTLSSVLDKANLNEDDFKQFSEIFK
ncbi:DUF4252 domain-containing protein [Lacinutrix undariae]